MCCSCTAPWPPGSSRPLSSCSPSPHGDQAVLRVDRKDHWMHAYCGGEITLKLLHRKRGREATDSINITPRYGGTLIHHGLAVYFS
jgi:transposase